MLRLRRFTSAAIVSIGTDSTCARIGAGCQDRPTGPPDLTQRIPARSSAAAQVLTIRREGSCATAEIPAVRRSIPIQPSSVQPPSGSERRDSLLRPPATVVAAIRTIPATPSG